MADIASRSHGATTGLVYGLHHITRSMLHHIEEERSIVGYDKKESTSHGPSFRPLVSSTPIVCSPFEVEVEGELIVKVVIEMVREVVVHLNRHYLLPYPPYLPITRYSHTSILLHTYPSPDTFIPPQTYTSPSLPPDTYASLPYVVSLEPASMAVDITLSSHPLSSPTLSPIDETMVDLVSKLGTLLARRHVYVKYFIHQLPRLHRLPSALSTLFEIARDPIDQLAMYSRRHLKRNIKTPSCETH